MLKDPINPRVSIGMPVFNGERYLEDTLNSVLNQTYTDFVIYITDNASTDGTEEICKKYAAKDSRIVYKRYSVNVGAAKNYERCFKPANSEYFRWQNADDPIEPRLIEKCIKVLDRYPDVVLAYGKTNIIDGESKFVKEYDDNLELLQDHPSRRFIKCLEKIRFQNLMYGLIRREQLSKTARMKAYVSADINLIAELTLYGKFFEIKEHLFNCRRHEECSSWNMKDKEKLRNFWDPTKKKLLLQTWRNFFEYYKAVFRSPIELSQKSAISCYLFRRAYWQKNIFCSELHEYIKAISAETKKKLILQ